MSHTIRLPPAFGRRIFLATAALGGLGLSLPQTQAAPPGASPLGRIRSCILVFFYGGPSHLDTFDPKPNAPAEVRGEYAHHRHRGPRRSRRASTCREPPALMDRVALVRSLHHPMRNHNSAAAEALTGRTPAGGDQELLTDDPRGIPTLGSAVSYALGVRADVLPYVALPYTIYNVVQLPGQTPACSAALTTASRWRPTRAVPTSASRRSTAAPHCWAGRACSAGSTQPRCPAPLAVRTRTATGP